ncbi:TadE family protein [Brooklawnia sp.]|uniref:TadE/TadG family type IV pilus assembly protein n=1 Tax=Brooklawnia sp. TaxID=2699740 RepID=UPI00311E3732
MTKGSRLLDERGSATIPYVVLLPILFGVLFTGLQFGLYFRGCSAASSTASMGARAAAAENGTQQACREAAAAFAVSLGDAIDNPHITCSMTSTAVTVRVTGTTLSVMPGWVMQADRTITLPKERLT